jgi:N-acetyl-D-muramate 6-phosphate phosphatase
MRNSIEAVLFDFDGTVADTAPDLAYALNVMRVKRGLSSLPLTHLRGLASEGARGMLRIGFDLHPHHDEYNAMREEYLDVYEANMLRETQLFHGMAQVLEELERRGVPWGIVTNKLERFALPLLDLMGLAQRAGCIVGGDTTAKPKPAPDPLLEAARRVNADPRNCLYVGDDLRDVQAAIAAAMEPVVALYGYLGNDEPPEQWGASKFVHEPLDLLKFL